MIGVPEGRLSGRPTAKESRAIARPGAQPRFVTPCPRRPSDSKGFSALDGLRDAGRYRSAASEGVQFCHRGVAPCCLGAGRGTILALAFLRGTPRAARRGTYPGPDTLAAEGAGVSRGARPRRGGRGGTGAAPTAGAGKQHGRVARRPRGGARRATILDGRRPDHLGE
jgi:hypothetical protein